MTNTPEAVQGTVPQLEEKGESYGRMVWRQFRRNPLGMASLGFVLVLLLVALLADFLANDKPIVARYQGRWLFPVLQEYAVGLGLASWGELGRVDWKAVALRMGALAAGAIPSGDDGSKSPEPARASTIEAPFAGDG
jgi:ABC-type uncharacterized transport system, permease component, COG4239